MISKQKTKYILIIGFTVLFFQCCTNKATRLYLKAQNAQERGFNNDAIELYKKSIENGGNKAKLNFLIAENYRITNRIREAAPYYAASLKAKTKDDKAIFYYALALKSLGKYEDAKVYFEKYAKKGTNRLLKERAEAEVKFLKRIYELIYLNNSYYIKNLGKCINTSGPEYAPIITQENNIIYTAENKNTTYKATGTGFTDIFIFNIADTINTSLKNEPYDGGINNTRTHEACLTLSKDGNYMVYAKSNTGKRKGSIDTDLYYSEMTDGKWTNPSVADVSDPRYWESTPSFDPDSKTLYFASNRRGGYGGIDIWKTTVSDSGWSKPINLGPQINTSGNELFPYMREDGVFFFASDGHPGLGGLDIFAYTTKAMLLDSMEVEANTVNNLGAPINSNADDFGIVYHPSLQYGYFSSNRDGGFGDDDIYKFWIAYKEKRTIPKSTICELSISVKSNENNEQDLPMDSTSILVGLDMYDYYIDTLTNEKGFITLEVDSNYTYYVKAEKKGYFVASNSFEINKMKFEEEQLSPFLFKRKYSATMNLDKIVVGKEIVLKNIFYDYNKADIREDAEPDLQMLIEFLKKNPKVEIELGSHTDSRGNDDYNLRLSQARAKNAVDYLIANGIEKERVKAVGYGESKPIIVNAQTEEEHQINRRTEFTIVKSGE
jgi:outer membrane protein OmpA-like peptidoglycan-associated protein